MMNILEIQDALKNMSNEQLIREVRMPSGSAPPFLVASEMDRRQNMRQRFAEKQPQSTVIDDLTMQMNQGIGGMMPQPMPMNQPMGIPQPMGMPKSSPEPMPARGMFLGGLARLLGRAATPRVNPATMGSADDILINPAGAALRRGGASTIPSNRQLIPYQPPVSAAAPSAGAPSASSRMGLFGLKGSSIGSKALQTGLAASPLGLAGLLGLNVDSVGDGTLAGAYGLTDDEFERILKYMQQEGLDFSTDSTEFADLAAQLTGKNVPRLSQLQATSGSGGLFSQVVTPETREQEALANQAKEQAEEIKKAQEEARNIFEERDKRRMQAGILGAGLETIIRGQRGEPVLGAIAEGLKSQALPAFKEKGEMQLAAQIKRNLQDAKIAAEAQGKVGDLVKLRASIAKQAGETVDPDAKASIVQTLAALDQFLFQRFGISSGAGTGSQNFLQQLLGEQSARQATVKDATR